MFNLHTVPPQHSGHRVLLAVMFGISALPAQVILAPSANAQVSVFEAPTTGTSFIVPNGVFQVEMELWGAGGGGYSYDGSNNAGGVVDMPPELSPPCQARCSLFSSVAAGQPGLAALGRPLPPTTQ